LIQGAKIQDSTLLLVVNRDVWDALSKQDHKLFFNGIKPIWDNIYAKHNSGSSAVTNVILFDLNGELVTTYASVMFTGS
jgi:hypothetical protein